MAKKRNNTKKSNQKTQSMMSKNEKKYNNKNNVIINESVSDNDIKFSKIIKIILGIVVIFGVFYLLTFGIQKWQKNKNTTLNTNTNKIQYDEILMSKILKQSSDDYYVLVISSDDNSKSSFTTYVNQMQITKMYTADLDSAFNRQYKSEESNLTVENIEELKVKETSLLHVQNHVVTEGVEGSCAVLEKVMRLY